MSKGDSRYCSTCRKYIPNEVRCDYDWSGNCSAGDYVFVRDAEPVRSGKGVAIAALEALLRRFGKGKST